MERINNFCDSVLGCIPRATRREKDDIRDELLDHLLEHKDVLIGYGLEEAEAEKRAVEAMGDAEGIGKAWNEKLSPVWLWSATCMPVRRSSRRGGAARMNAIRCSVRRNVISGRNLAIISSGFTGRSYPGMRCVRVYIISMLIW